MQYPNNINILKDFFEKYPGIGKKTAEKLALHSLSFDSNYLNKVSHSISTLKSNVTYCEICNFIKDSNEKCSLCFSSRDNSILCIVENIRDVFALLETSFTGRFYVLGGLIDPLNGISASDLKTESLLPLINSLLSPLEIIISTPITMEGESTALYLKQFILKNNSLDSISFSRLARGMPTGSSLEYADK